MSINHKDQERARDVEPTFFAAQELAKAAAGYIERGWTVVPVPAREKSPGFRDWQALRVPAEEAPRYFENGQNIGLHCGEPSGWLVPADLDSPEARKLAGRFLPPTLTSGRESTPDSHWWFYAQGAEHRTFKDLDGSMILELRSTGHHTLVSPSKHPSGESYSWSASGLDIERVGAASLLFDCRQLASAALIARHLPEGGRHDICMALVGFMLRRELSEETTAKILHAAWDAKGFAGDPRARDTAHQDIEGIVRDTAAKLRDDKPATGGKRLEDLIPGLRGKLAGFWDWSGRLDDEAAREEFNRTDLGNSARLVAHHGADLRYCYPWGSWLIWDGRRWSLDESGEIHRRAKRTVREIYREAADAADDETRKALGKHAKASEAENRIQAMISLAKSEVPIMPTAMDRDPWLLNVEGGTVDLRTGELLEHRRDDLITKLAGEYDPEASTPAWTATLERVLPSAEVRAFFKRLCGYAISGDVSEHVLPVLYGTGANGKSTILNALLEAAGEYGMQAAPDLLIAKRGGHPTEVADLFGMRVVASIEVEDGRRLAEALVKSLTGGDKVRARRMRQDFWEFDPTHTAFLCTNHKPELRGTDTAIWRRIRLIPFEQTIPPAEQDKKLPEKLRAELPGILAWAVEGCLEWQREGLKAPEEVRKATAGYRSEMDVVGAFLRDECEIGESGAEGYKATLKDVYSRYEEWCEEGGEKPETRRKFNARLTERGQFRDRRSGPGGLREWHGLKLLTKRNAAFAGKLTQRPQNDYNRLESSSRSVNGTKHVSTSVRQSEEPVHREPGAWEGRF